jgi:hypothetical protein
MEQGKKRPDMLELRRQRERIRRVTVGAMVAALVVVLVSCQGLTARAGQERHLSTRLSYETQAASPTDRLRERF